MIKKISIALIVVNIGLFAVAEDPPAKLVKANVELWDGRNPPNRMPLVVTAEGMWRADILNEDSENAFDTVAHVECYRTGGELLTGTPSYCMEADAQLAYEIPNVEVDYFPVLSWSNSEIVAANSSSAAFPICTWTQITINLNDGSVMAVDSKKEGKGHEGLNNSCSVVPLARSYHLVDTAQEMVRRQIRKAKKEKEAEAKEKK